jgi:hypothetical protein
MIAIGIVLLVIALVLFLLAAIGAVTERINFGWLGLAFLAAYFLVR